MRILKWIGIVLLAILVLVGIAGGVMYFMGSSNMTKAPEVPVKTITIPSDAAAIARGEHLANAVTPCAECHGENFGGTVMIDEAPIGYLPATNLTAGQGGIGATFTDEDWERAIRHGVGSTGQTLAVMPSYLFSYLTDEDLGALIAYMKQVPPVDNELGERRLQFLGTIVFGLLGYGAMPVSLIHHADVGSLTPPEGSTPEYGEYLTHIAGCVECHSSNLAGNTDPNGPPIGPNITPGGALADFNEQQFIAFMRSGMTPDGIQVSDEMPWEIYQGMTDTEIQAIWMYLSGLTPLPDNS